MTMKTTRWNGCAAMRPGLMAAALGLACSVQAGSGAWSGAADGNWSDPANWQGGVYASGAGATAHFTNGASVTVRQDLGSLTLGSLYVSGASVAITNNDMTLNGGGASTITVGGAADTAALWVRLYGTAGQTLVKEGDGTLVFGKNASGMGGLTLNGGLTLLAFPGNSDGLNVGTGTITVNDGATFKFGAANQVNNQAVIDVKSGGVFDVNGQTDNIGAITGEGVVTNLGGTTLNFRLNGLPRLFSGKLYGNATFHFAEPGGSLVAGTSNLLENIAFNLYSSGLLAFAPGIGTFYVGSLNTTNAQTLALQDTAGDPVTLALGSRNGDITLGATLAGAGGLEKVGTAILTLTNAHTYAGLTTVSGGTLRLGDGTRDCALTNSSGIRIVSGRTVAFNTAADQTYDNPVSGFGTLTKAGAGTLTLNDLQLAPGSVAVSAGTLALNGGNSSGVTFTANSGSALHVNGGNYLMGGFTLNTGSGPLAFAGGSSTGATLVANNGTAVEVTGGTHLFASPLGGNNRNNRYTQTGGTASFTTAEGMGNTNVIYAIVSGGTLTVNTLSVSRGLGLLASGSAVVNIIGGQRVASDGWSHSLIVSNNASVTAQTLQFMSTSAASSTGIVTLAGGTLTVSGLGNGEANAISPVFVNFDGGLLRFSANTDVAANGYSTFAVQAGGARIDSGTGTPTLRQPLVSGTAGTDGGLAKTGVGTLTLTTNATYTGQTIAKAGTLRTTSAGGTPFGGGNLLLAGGTLQAQPAGSGLAVGIAAADGTVGGTVAYGTGPSALKLAKGSNSSVALTLGNGQAAAESVLVRSNRGVLAIIPSGGTVTLGSTEKLLVNGGVPVINGMASASLFGVHNSDDRLPCDFLTYGVNGFQTAAYTDGLGGGATSIANVTTNSAADSAEVYALRVTAGAMLTIKAGQTLTVGDGINPAGVIINNSSSTRAGITNGTLAFGSSEGVVLFNLRHQNNNGPTLNSVVTGSNGLTLAGETSDADLLLGSAGNTYTGGTRIMAGCVSLTNANGFSTGDVYVHGNEGGGGQFKFSFAGTMANAFHLAGVGGTPSGVPAGAVRFDASGILSGPVELMADTRVGTPALTAVGTLGGVVSGPYGLEIGCPGQNWGKVRLTGANTYSGVTRVSAGTLEVGEGGTLGAGPVVNNATLAFNVAGDLTVTNPISGTGRVLQNGNGTLTLSGANTYSGVTEVNAGTLVIGGTVFGGNALSLSGTLDLGGQNLALGRLAGSGAVSNSSGGAVTLTVGAGNADSLFWGAIRDGAGTTALNKTGAGTLTLSGLSTYSGATVVGAGTVKLQGVLATAPTNGLAYQLDASDVSKLTLDGSNVAVWADSTAAGVNFTQSLAHLRPVYVTNAINGLAAVRFTGVMTNRMAAAKSVSAQTVFIVNKMTGFMNLAGIWGRDVSDSGIRANSSTAWQLGGDNNDFAYGGQMFINGAPGNAFPASAPHLLTAISATQRTGWPTAIGDYWGNAANRRAYTGDIGEVLVYSTALGSSDRQAVEQYLSYKWLGLSAPVPTNVLPAATSLVVSNNAALDLNGLSQAVGSLSGAGAVANSSGAWSTLTVGGDNASTLFSGTISGSNALVKVGFGTLTLSGANAYLGNTLVSGGVLRLAGGANRLPTGGTVTVDAGAALDLNGQAQTLAGIGGSGAVTGGSLTVDGIVAPGGVGTVGTLTFMSAPALSGTLLIDTRLSGVCDLLSVDGDLDVSALALQMADTAQMAGHTYTVAVCVGNLTGAFAVSNLPKSWSLRYDRASGAGKVVLVHRLGTLLSLR